MNLLVLKYKIIFISLLSLKREDKLFVMRKILFVVLILGFVSPLFGQRLIHNQWSVGADVAIAPMGGCPISVSLNASRFLLKGKSLYAIKMLTWSHNYTSAAEEYIQPVDIDTRSYDFSLSFGHLWLLHNNRSRSFNLWAGGTVDLGFRRYVVTKGGSADRLPSGAFMYGLSPFFGAEFFTGKQFSLTAFFEPVIHFSARGSRYSNDSKDKVFFPAIGIKASLYL